METEGRFRVDVAVAGESKWATNALRFDTKGDATDYAHDLASRWMLVTAARVVESTTPNQEPLDMTDERIVLDWT